MENTIESTELIRWDLSILYTDIADPRLDSDLSALTAMARHFSADLQRQAGGIAGRGDPGLFGNRNAQRQNHLLPFLRESTDLTNAAIKAKHAAFQRELSAIRGEHLTFFELELVQLSDETLEDIL